MVDRGIAVETKVDQPPDIEVIPDADGDLGVDETVDPELNTAELDTAELEVDTTEVDIAEVDIAQVDIAEQDIAEEDTAIIPDVEIVDIPAGDEVEAELVVVVGGDDDDRDAAPPATPALAGLAADGPHRRRQTMLALVLLAILAAVIVALIVTRDDDAPASEAESPAEAENVIGPLDGDLTDPAETDDPVSETPESTTPSEDGVVEQSDSVPVEDLAPPPDFTPLFEGLADRTGSGDGVAESRAVVRGGQIFLEGAVPNQEAADAIVELAAAVLGPDNVINNYTINPNAGDPNLGNVRVDDNVLFLPGSAVIAADFEPLLGQALALLTIRPAVTMTIVGHTDDIGSEDENLALSLLRAQAVAQWLVERGIDPTRLVAEGRGETAPIADNTTAEGRQLNRRIQVFIENLLSEG